VKPIKFLRWFCREDYLDEIEGDLMEIFTKEQAHSARKARWKLAWRVVRYFRPEFIKPLKNFYPPKASGMYKSYIKVGWRNLLRDKGYSLINIGGLAIGMAFALLIGLWIQYETSFDSFHEKQDRLALVMKHTLFNDIKGTQEATPFPLNDELKAYPEVNHASKVSFSVETTFARGSNAINKTGIYVDPDFLQMFSFKLLQGDKTTALNDPYSLVVTEAFAKIMFGDENPIGKLLVMDNRHDMQVTGVIQDVPPNSTFQFDFLGSYEFQVKTSPFVRDNRTNWGNNFMMNMVELKEGVSMDAFSNKISKLNTEKDAQLKNLFLFLHPMKKWHLENDYSNWVNTGGRIRYVRLFTMVGSVVLLIACINFMNLSTARSQKRAKEVGVRKSIGSQRGQIMVQFLTESMLTACLAFVLAIGLIIVILPYIRSFGFGNIAFGIDNTFLMVLCLLVCIGVGLIAGSYPALYLSSFQPVSILKGMLRSGKGPAAFRRVLVVFQFTISIGLMVSTLAVFQQIRYAQSRPLGYDPENLISIRATETLYKNFQPLKRDLLESSYIEAVATTSSPLTSVYNKWSDFSWEGKEPGSDIALEALMTEWDFEKVARLRFKAGRPFSIEHGTDSNAVIINESAMKIMGYKDPVGRTMKSGSQELKIVGVVEDMLMLDPFKSISPGVIIFNPQAVNAIVIRVKDGMNIKDALASIDLLVRKHNAAQVFTYSFVTDDYRGKFHLENQVGQLVAIFAGLAMFISCLGLMGLTSFMAEQRVKEIGIRKVLGASVASLWNLLSKELIVLIGISFAIASPAVYYLIGRWLENYQYRITLSVWMFMLVGLSVLVVALVTVSYQSIKAVLASPVKSLKTE
jgi:putative ABC transport system permease protein